MEVIDKLNNIPMVERSCVHAKSAYDRIKLYPLFWGVQHAENIAFAVADSLQPAVRMLSTPIGIVDAALCRSVDYVEQKIPAIYLPPEMIYENTKSVITERLRWPIERPVRSALRVRDAMLGNRTLSYAADRIDGALDVADRYVERFLPPADAADADRNGTSNGGDEKHASDATESEASEDRVDSPPSAVGRRGTDSFEDGGDFGSTAPPAVSRPGSTLSKGRRLSVKLKRRLTMRTISEARALQHGSREAVHIVRYAAELLVRDPKQALRQMGELWRYLSADEPDNQARPQTLEQVIVLVLREGARKVVHLSNYVGRVAGEIPKSCLQSSTATAVHVYVETTLSKVRVLPVNQLQSLPKHLNQTIKHRYSQFENYLNDELEWIAYKLAGREKQ